MPGCRRRRRPAPGAAPRPASGVAGVDCRLVRADAAGSAGPPRRPARRPREQRADPAPLLVGPVGAAHRAGAMSCRTRSSSARPVPLPERRALALAVVGQDHEAGTAAARAATRSSVASTPSMPSSAASDSGRAGPGVVGDLVVVDEVAVDATARPRIMCSAMIDRLRSPQQHVGHAAQQPRRRPARWIRGSTPRTRCRRAWCSSLTISPAVSTSERVRPNGSSR